MELERVIRAHEEEERRTIERFGDTPSEIIAEMAWREIAKIPRERWDEILYWYRRFDLTEEEFQMTLRAHEVAVVETIRQLDYVLQQRGLCLTWNEELKTVTTD